MKMQILNMLSLILLLEIILRSEIPELENRNKKPSYGYNVINPSKSNYDVVANFS